MDCLLGGRLPGQQVEHGQHIRVQHAPTGLQAAALPQSMDQIVPENLVQVFTEGQPVLDRVASKAQVIGGDGDVIT